MKNRKPKQSGEVAFRKRGARSGGSGLLGGGAAAAPLVRLGMNGFCCLNKNKIRKKKYKLKTRLGGRKREGKQQRKAVYNQEFNIFLAAKNECADEMREAEGPAGKGRLEGGVRPVPGVRAGGSARLWQQLR